MAYRLEINKHRITHSTFGPTNSADGPSAKVAMAPATVAVVERCFVTVFRDILLQMFATHDVYKLQDGTRLKIIFPLVFSSFSRREQILTQNRVLMMM